MPGLPECWFFCQKAGLAISDVVRHLSRPTELPQPQPILVVAAGVNKKHVAPTDPSLIALPVLTLASDTPASTGLTLEDAVVVSMLAAPKQLVPQPRAHSMLAGKGLFHVAHDPGRRHRRRRYIPNQPH